MVDENDEHEDVVELEEGDALELPARAEVKIRTDTKYEDLYKSMEELGKGKFGVVNRCERISDGVHLAAKYIKKTAAAKKEVMREIEMMNKLHHKRLISLHDAFETRNDMIIIMELVTGGELFEKVVEEDNLTEKQVIRYTKQILYGVQHMHRKAMVHLDLKPENILCLGGEKPGYEEIKLIDFGMTRVVVDGEEESAICGTPEFVAPEVINYDPVTVAADMWSMGVITYVLLSGLSPFMGEDDNETLANVSAGEYDFEDDEDDDEEDQVFSNLSDDVKLFISELLILDPTKRLTVEQALNHKWLQSVGRDKKLDVGNLKKFIARRRWQKTTNTIKAVSRLAGGLNLFQRGKERTHGHEAGTFLEKVKKQEQKELEEERLKNEALGMTSVANDSKAACEVLEKTGVANDSEVAPNEVLENTGVANDSKAAPNEALEKTGVANDSKVAPDEAVGKTVLANDSKAAPNEALGMKGVANDSKAAPNEAVGKTVLANDSKAAPNEALGKTSVVNGSKAAPNEALGKTGVSNDSKASTSSPAGQRKVFGLGKNSLKPVKSGNKLW